jgi:hypothetical protein
MRSKYAEACTQEEKGRKRKEGEKEHGRALPRTVLKACGHSNDSCWQLKGVIDNGVSTISSLEGTGR